MLSLRLACFGSGRRSRGYWHTRVAPRHTTIDGQQLSASDPKLGDVIKYDALDVQKAFGFQLA